MFLCGRLVYWYCFLWQTTVVLVVGCACAAVVRFDWVANCSVLECLRLFISCLLGKAFIGLVNSVVVLIFVISSLVVWYFIAAVNCFGGVLRLFIDLLCTLRVGWLCCFICCGWWLLCLVVCCGVVAVVVSVVDVYLVGIAIGVVCWLGGCL